MFLLWNCFKLLKQPFLLVNLLSKVKMQCLRLNSEIFLDLSQLLSYLFYLFLESLGFERLIEIGFLDVYDFVLLAELLYSQFVDLDELFKFLIELFVFSNLLFVLLSKSLMLVKVILA
jgi:hypothetical protein